jgi:hypothetical protein
LKDKDGARRPTVVEPMVVIEEYPIQWKRQPVDLTKLAKLRWIEKWSVARLAQYFDRSPETIQMHICRQRKPQGLHKLALNDSELAEIQKNQKKLFKGV